MTLQAFYPEKMTKFSLWIRKNCKDSKDGLTLTNIDFLFSEYKKKRIMIIEEKTHGKTTLSFGQSQIFKLLDAALKFAPIEPWKYDGIFVVSFSNEDPDDSDKILINNIQVTKQQLIDFLNFDISFFDILQPTKATAPDGSGDEPL